MYLLASPLFDEFLCVWQCTAVAEGFSSPTRTFPLGDCQAGSANRKTPKECCLSILIVQIDDQAKVAGAVAAPPSSRSAPGCSSPSGTLRLDRGAVKKAATLGKRSLKQHPCRGDSIDTFDNPNGSCCVGIRCLPLTVRSRVFSYEARCSSPYRHFVCGSGEPSRVWAGGEYRVEFTRGTEISWYD